MYFDMCIMYTKYIKCLQRKAPIMPASSDVDCCQLDESKCCLLDYVVRRFSLFPKKTWQQISVVHEPIRMYYIPIYYSSSMEHVLLLIGDVK